MTEWIGLMAAVLTTGCYVPQALHVIRERTTSGISLIAYIALLIGVTLWCIYGILISNIPLILANGITTPLVLIVVVMKIRHMRGKY